METVTDFIFLGSKITADGDCNHEIKRHLLFGIKAITNLDTILKSRDNTLPTKVRLAAIYGVAQSWTRLRWLSSSISSQSYGFSSGHVWMWELDYKESWAPKNWCFWTVVGEDSWESLGLQGDPTSWIFFGRTDVEAETPILWPPDVKSWLIWKDPDAGNDWGKEEKGTTEDEMAGWHHRLDGHGFGWTLGVGNGQGGLVCCGSCGCEELDMTEWLNLIENNKTNHLILYRNRLLFILLKEFFATLKFIVVFQDAKF